MSPVKNGDKPALFPPLSEESPERGDAQLVLSLSELIRPWAKHWWGLGGFFCIVAFHPCNNPMRTLLFISSFSESLNNLSNEETEVGRGRLGSGAASLWGEEGVEGEIA